MFFTTCNIFYTNQGDSFDFGNVNDDTNSSVFKDLILAQSLKNNGQTHDTVLVIATT